MRRGSIVLGALVVLAIVAFGPALINQLSKKTASPALATASVSAFPVTATATGTLLPQSLQTLNFPIGGQVSEIDVQPGAHVTKGQLLAKLNDASQQASLQSAQASLSAAEAALRAATTPGAVASAQAQVANANGQVQRAQLEDAKTVLTAPQAGTVLEINAQVGNTVTAGSTGTPVVNGSGTTIVAPDALTSGKVFMAIGNGSSFQVSAAFSQSDATGLQAAQTGTVSFDALPGVNFPCHLAAIASVASVINGVTLFYAAVAPDQTDPRLRIGMTANVIINIAQATNVLAVPSAALYLLNNAPYVNVWYQGRAVPTRVVTGLAGSHLTQIVSGLSQGEQVVLSAPQTLPTTSGSSAATPTP
jgi:macrolide-specific efflux system membrane fusion protein